MEAGINIGFFAKRIPMAKAAELVAKAGFTHLDYTPPVEQDDWESVMKESCRIFEANGLSVHQTHAPFNRYGRYGEKHKLCLDRCMEATAFMGAKYIAVHGDEFDFDTLTYSEEAALSYNHDYFAPYVEKSEKAGFKLAFETVFEDHPTRKRFTSAPEDLLRLIESFKSEHAVCCWDFGHAHVSFPYTAAEWIPKFGSRIQCMHLHDNTGKDAHQLPMTGDIHWPKMMQAFKEIGYKGVWNVEYSHGNIPESLLPDFLTLTKNTVRYLNGLCE
ncbi:MAG: sugar phosphate isomerase/epimerase [Clostridia bacterium]|nr:sugar phosphate isomerase/epimerase [Clostridia bacterium]